MSLIFLIFKGSQQPTKIEQYIIERTIIEYYREYFTPFEGFSEEEKKELHQTLVIAAKSNGEYEKYEEELQARNGTGSYDVTDEERAKYERNSRLSEKLQAVVDDAASTEGEKNAARNQLQRLTPEIVEGKFLKRSSARLPSVSSSARAYGSGNCRSTAITSLPVSVFLRLSMRIASSSRSMTLQLS